MQAEDIIVWPNDVWCFREDLEGMNHMSDDYRVLPFESDTWKIFMSSQSLDY